MLGTLGGYASEIVKNKLEYALKQPLGFRVWRVITALVMLSRRESHTPSLRRWVRRELTKALRSFAKRACTRAARLILS